jgi:transposase
MLSWKIAFNGQMVLVLSNARRVTKVPGEKTDKEDSKRIAVLLRAGLLRGSFIPPLEIRELHDYTRYRVTLVEDSSAQKNRIEKLLQGEGIKLSSFVSDIFGVSGRAILDYISLHGSVPFDIVRDMLKGRLKSKEDDINRALQISLSHHKQDMLQMLLRHLDMISAQIMEVERKIASSLENFKGQVDLLSSIPGIQARSAAAIIAEIGIDMSHFFSDRHIAAWAGMSPGNNESGGKKKPTRILNGNPYIKRILCEIAWVITRMRTTPLSQWYWKLRAKRGAKKALVALGRKLLVIIYSVLKSGSPYDETKVVSKQKDQIERRKKALLRELKRLGVEVEVMPVA